MNSDQVANRLKRLIEAEKSISSFARKCGVRDSLLRKYLAGAMPGLDKAAVIAEAAGVNLEWLATGRGPMRPEPQAPQALQSEPLAASIRIVERWLDAHKRVLQPEKKATVVLAIYEIIVQDLQEGRPPFDERRAASILRLVA